MKWEIVELTQNKLIIQIKFETPLQISFDTPDYLVVIFADKDLWISETGSQIASDYRQLRRALMKQLPEDAE